MDSARKSLTASAGVSGMASSAYDATSFDEFDDIDRLQTVSERDVLVMVRSPEHLLFNDANEAKEVVLVDRDRQPFEDFAELGNATVLLHVYDLHEDLQGTNGMLAFTLEDFAMGGLFHVGVEVFGSEWSYGYIGVCCDPPRTLEAHEYRCTVVLGPTHLNSREVAGAVYDMCQSWSGREYDIISRNCCSFATEFCSRLGVGTLPPWVDRFARALDHGKKLGRAFTKFLNEEVAGYAEMKPTDGQVEVVEVQQGNSTPSVPSMPSTDMVPAFSGDSQKSIAATQSMQRNPSNGRSNQRSRSPVSTRLPSKEGRSSSLTPQGREGAQAATFPPGTLQEKPMGRQRSSSRARTASTTPQQQPPVERQSSSSRQPSVGPRTPPRSNRSPSVDPQAFPIGSVVEYEESGLWVARQVLAFNADTGLYDLDGRRQVPGRKLRHPQSQNSRRSKREGSRERHSANNTSQQPPSQQRTPSDNRDITPDERLRSIRQAMTEGQFRTRRPRNGRRAGCC